MLAEFKDVALLRSAEAAKRFGKKKNILASYCTCSVVAVLSSVRDTNTSVWLPCGFRVSPVWVVWYVVTFAQTY